MRHRRGTPGLTPYRLRTIEAGHPRRRRPARHLRQGKASAPQPGLASTLPSGLPSPLPGVSSSRPAGAASPTPGTMAPPDRCWLVRRTAATRHNSAAYRNTADGRRDSTDAPSADPRSAHARSINANSAADRLGTAARRRVAGSQVAMGFAGLIALALLVVGGYQAAAGAAVVLGMF